MKKWMGENQNPNQTTLCDAKTLRACLVVYFKYCCSKWYKNCDLKNIEKTCVQSTFYAKKSIWYYISNNIFFKVKKYNYVFDICRCF